MLLKETINDITLDKGIFQYISELGVFSWLTPEDAKLIDINYYLNHSGNKTITPLFEGLLSNISVVAKIIALRYSSNWNRVYDAYIESQYDPIENYSMIESEEYASKITNTRNMDSSTFAFNSVDPVPTDKGLETSTSSGSASDNNRKLTRSGNIGVTTSQQMLQSEIDLRKFIFYDKIMLDVDQVLTLMIYE